MALFIAVQSFVIERRGRSEWINAGEVAEHGSWPVDAHPGAFRPLQIRWKAPVTAASGPVPADDPAGDPSVSPASLKRRGGRPANRS